MGATEERLAEFVAETDVESIPPEAFRAAQDATFDCLGVTLAGAAEPLGGMITSFVEEEGAAPVSTIVGSRLRTSPYLAALANGTLAHALDYDDVGGLGHSSVALTPTVLALGEKLGSSGRDVLDAYVIGFEAASHIRAGSSYVQGIRGFHNTGVFGTIGATAAASRLLRLDRHRTLMALGLSGSMSSGIVQNFGTYAKPLHAGMACRAGVLAATLAEKGWTATDAFIESGLGWAHAYLGAGNYEPSRMVADLGERWTVLDSIVVKKYPCCGSNHSALDSLLSLMKEHEVTLDDVEKVEVERLPAISHVLLYPEPSSGFQGRFSIHYNMAVALMDRQVVIESHTDEQLRRPEYAEALDKIDIKVMSSWDPHYEPGPRENPVTLRLKDGQVFRRSTNRHQMHGSPSDPLSETELKDKFRNCARLALPEGQVEEAVRACWELGGAANVSETLRALTPAG